MGREAGEALIFGSFGSSQRDELEKSGFMQIACAARVCALTFEAKSDKSLFATPTKPPISLVRKLRHPSHAKLVLLINFAEVQPSGSTDPLC